MSQKVCDFRNILNLVTKSDFEAMYSKATEVDIARITSLVEAGAYEALRTWYRSKLTRELGDKSVRDLRQIASELVIPDYARMPKAILLSEIVKRQNAGKCLLDDKVTS